MGGRTANSGQTDRIVTACGPFFGTASRKGPIKLGTERYGGYSRTFSAESSDTIYLLADTDNFLSLRKTFVYYRPAEDALKIDTTLLDDR